MYKKTDKIGLAVAIIVGLLIVDVISPIKTHIFITFMICGLFLVFKNDIVSWFMRPKYIYQKDVHGNNIKIKTN